MKKEKTTSTTSLYDTKWSLKKIHTDAAVEEVNTKAFIKFNLKKKVPVAMAVAIRLAAALL